MSALRNAYEALSMLWDFLCGRSVDWAGHEPAAKPAALSEDAWLLIDRAVLVVMVLAIVVIVTVPMVEGGAP